MTVHAPPNSAFAGQAYQSRERPWHRKKDEDGASKSGAKADKGGAEQPRAETKAEQPKAGNASAPIIVPPSATPFKWRDPATIPPREFLFRHHLIRRFLSATVSPGGVGKSSKKAVEALSMACGYDLLDGGERIVERKVWLVNLEDPIEETEKKIVAAMIHYEIKKDDIGDRLFFDSGRNQDFVVAETIKSGTTIRRPIVDGLIAEIKKHKIDVLIVDPFVSSHRCPESDNGAIDAVAKQWSKVAEEANCAIELIHHARKVGDDARVTVESARGAKALTDAARSVAVLNRMTEGEAEKAGIDKSHARSYFSDFIDKGNLQPPANRLDWFKLENVELPNGDSVGVVTSWEWPDAFEDVTTKHLRQVQSLIADGDGYRLDVQARNWAGHVIARVLDIGVVDPEDAFKRKLTPADRSKVKAILSSWIEKDMLRTKRGIDQASGRETTFVRTGKLAD